MTPEALSLCQQELWSEDLTDAQLKMVIASGDGNHGGGFGVELRGANWRTARALVAAGCGTIEGGAPNGSDLPGLYFNNAHGVEVFNEFADKGGLEECPLCGRTEEHFHDM